jgi:hypothetical protein
MFSLGEEGERRGVCGVSVGKPNERRPLEDLALDGRMILEWIVKKSSWMAWTVLIWLGIRESCGLL